MHTSNHSSKTHQYAQKTEIENYPFNYLMHPALGIKTAEVFWTTLAPFGCNELMEPPTLSIIKKAIALNKRQSVKTPIDFHRKKSTLSKAVENINYEKKGIAHPGGITLAIESNSNAKSTNDMTSDNKAPIKSSKNTSICAIS